jgi:hypothetical protein
MLTVIDPSAALAAVTLVYLVIAIGGIDHIWTIEPGSRWAFAPTW